VFLEGQGKELRTRQRYVSANNNWISPVLGTKPVRRVSAEDIDRCFAAMRRAGQSASSMNQAKALLSGAFKWARDEFAQPGAGGGCQGEDRHDLWRPWLR
jgi:hypothetical protein